MLLDGVGVCCGRLCLHCSQIAAPRGPSRHSIHGLINRLQVHISITHCKLCEVQTRGIGAYKVDQHPRTTHNSE